MQTLAALAEVRGDDPARSRLRSTPTSAAFAVTVVPKKELGQHFLVDENILGVIGRLAEIDATDVVLRSGRAGVPPATSPDRALLGPTPSRSIAARAGPARDPHTTPHWGDALALDPASSTRLREAGRQPSLQRRDPIVVESLDRYPRSVTGA
jgi:hypothetical protein